MGYTTWGCIDLVSAGTGEMKKRYGLFMLIKMTKEMEAKRNIKKSFYWYKKVIETNGQTKFE
ncbi:MAG: family 1 glycosylhydrolase [Faecalibacillus intestinalis]|uniref:family 1 glycosylhydrolase n=1 Tax=Faecalibacillus intestinalis TaxID=1982626 RepID=UPI00399FB1CD